MRSVAVIFSLLVAGAVQAQSTSDILITNVSVFDGQNQDLIVDASVLIEGNTIKTVSTGKMDLGDATVIDGKGGTLMPGMIDNHWHVSFAEIPVDILAVGDVSEVALRGAIGAEATVMRGFTTVRDMGGNPFAIKKLVDAGELVGPRIYPSGPPISQTSGHFDFRSKNAVPANPADPLDYWERNAILMTADGVPEVTKRVREALRMGATQIKLAAGGGTSSSFDPLDVQQYTLEEIRAAVEVASTWNTYVTVHAYTPTAVQTAIEAGVKVVEHGQLLEDETMALLAEKDIWLSLQPFVIEDDSEYAANPFVKAKQKVMVQGTAKAYELAKKHGLKVAFGTDVLFSPGGGIQQNKMVALLGSHFDYTPYEALRMVTYDNAQLLKLSGPRDPYPEEKGIIAEGALADLIIVAGNPLDDLSLVADPDQNFDLIMKDGVIHKNTLE